MPREGRPAPQFLSKASETSEPLRPYRARNVVPRDRSDEDTGTRCARQGTRVCPGRVAPGVDIRKIERREREKVRMSFKNSVASAMLAGGIAALGASTACQEAAPVAPPPVEVYVADVVVQDVPEYLDLVGQTAGSQDVEIRARVEGFLERVNFQEGTFVKAGASRAFLQVQDLRDLEHLDLIAAEYRLRRVPGLDRD